MVNSFVSRQIETFWSLLDPWHFMYLAATFVPTTILQLTREGKLLSSLFPPSRFKDAWFGKFWDWAGPQVKQTAEKRVIPLLEGRTSNGQITETPTGPGIEGVVMEIGAGSGFWVDIFSNRHLDNDKAQPKESGPSGLRHRGRSARREITKVYGVEPNRDQHTALRRRIKEAGLEDMYEIVPVGVEDLDGRIERESLDCIVSVLCLCSIPDPQRNLAELYGYLKKGGRWYVYEHVRTDVGWGMIYYQGEYPFSP